MKGDQIMEEKMEGMLSPYRVLDLTDEKGLLCGKLLGDLGADVIKIERPGGDPARNIGPFYHDEVDPEKSLFWWAFNTSKRGITLDIETSDGQQAFKKLVRGADFVIESFPPGYLDKLGLGYPALEELNPGIILVSITPFGQTGPYKDYKGPDIVAWAMGGPMYVAGDADRPPLRISHHSQAHLHAGAEAAAAALMALQYRRLTGEGQQVDVSIQECLARTTTMYQVLSSWDMNKVNQQRGGGLQPIRITRWWPCKDGYIVCAGITGTTRRDGSRPLIDWVEEEGMANDVLRGLDWESLLVAAAAAETAEERQSRMDRLREAMELAAEPLGKFFMSHTKAELLEGAVKHRALVYPVSTAADILESVQLAARDFWVDLEHAELGTTVTYPGPFAKTSEAPPMISHRAPLIAEHNREILEQESGLSRQTPVTEKHSQKGEKPRDKMLKGIKVADFTWNIAGPLATKTLADYGAEVIRIESASPNDLHRTASPFKDDIPGLNRCGSFFQWNTSKMGIALKLTHPSGLEIAKKLIARADIVIETFAGGVMGRLGLTYEEIKKIKPDIIMLSSCMMGQTGPHANHPGFGTFLTPLSGFNQIAGWPDREPAGLEFYTDYIGAHLNALIILAALDYRQRTGKGMYIDMSQYENGIQFMVPVILDYAVNGRIANRMGNRSVDAAPHGAYPCQGEERWCTIAVFTDEEWQSFSRVVGSPAWTKDPRFATLATRKENEDELDRLVGEWTINHSAEEVMNMLQTAGVAAGVVQTGEDLLEHDPQLKYRHFFWELDHPEIGKYRAPRPSFVLSKTAPELRRGPLLGEHNEYVLKDILGFSDEEIAELIIAGVLE